MGRINCSDDMLTEKTVADKEIYSGRVFKVVVRDILTPEGRHSTRELVFHNGGACILPVDKDLNCYFVKQFRSPLGKVLLEAPAGKIEPGEDPFDCVSREIVEETGYQALNIESFGSMVATPGYCSEIIHLYLGTDLKYVGGNPDESEYLAACRLPLSDALAMAESGKITDAKTLILIYKAARRFGI
ncbi:MAG: NUDIX hydrolase [Saccharofermentans sp.]|jgi:ADP-ribose pyrophosphatase|nr:NUDIX hydrolase [Mageeibacillus sp.]MCI1263460.1 NUDIX hydrolase [Saccharofermentans sp.]MCI1274898.1 NUDIX hydrolase [Saccharofermentans sp.]MCI1769131.1 NUDIX hydrolase [Mageeibacillus sp.]MCI2043995.1 NUDIX hydrolase [Mageeibacillus sp.]